MKGAQLPFQEYWGGYSYSSYAYELYSGETQITVAIIIEHITQLTSKSGCFCNAVYSSFSSSINGTHTDVVGGPRSQITQCVYIPAILSWYWFITVSWNANTYLYMEGRR